MAYEQRDNSGSVFNNDKKESEKHADLTGKGMIGGVMHWINVWKKKDKNGNTWLSIAFKPMEQHGQEDQTRSRSQQRSQPRGGQQRRDSDDPNW